MKRPYQIKSGVGNLIVDDHCAGPERLGDVLELICRYGGERRRSEAGNVKSESEKKGGLDEFSANG